MIFGAGWLFLLAIGMPVAFTLGFIAFAYLLLQDGPLISATQRIVAGVDTFPLLAVPMFVLAGEIMNSGGVTSRIFSFARALVGHFPGGLGQVNVLASFFASGMSGSAIADAAGLGKLEYKAMNEAGYPDEFVGPLSAASCILGPLIPPSIPMVVYGVMANASVGQLFIAGLVPGLLTTFALMIYVWYQARRKSYPRDARVGIDTVWRSFRDAFWALLTPVIIIGGIFSGVFTPTEAGAFTALYALFISMFVYRAVSLRRLPRIFINAAAISAVIGLIVAMANLVSYIMTLERIPQDIAQWLLGLSDNPLIILLMINVMLLVLGMFMDGMAILILTVPVFLPVTNQLGVDPVHFGVVVIMNIMIGVLTPPFGIGLFVISKVTGIPFRTMAVGILPFIIPLIIVLLIVTVFPNLVMMLPRLLF